MKRITTLNRAVDLFGAGKDGFSAARPARHDDQRRHGQLAGTARRTHYSQ